MPIISKKSRPSVPKVSLQVYTSGALYKRVRSAATKQGISLSAFVTNALEAQLSKLER